MAGPIQAGPGYRDKAFRSARLGGGGVVQWALSRSAFARGQGFTGFTPSFHFLIKLPALDTPISFSSNLIKDTLVMKPIFKG
jgi:hypothetical protein